MSILKEASGRFTPPDSSSREALGDEFVERFGGTREHEIRLWIEAVTDWGVYLCSSIVANLSSMLPANLALGRFENTLRRIR